MGSRTLPTVCEHGVTVDGGDFTESTYCPKCELAAYDAEAGDALLGRAWRLCEAALPEGWLIESVTLHDDCAWDAEAAVRHSVRMGEWARGLGPTPAAALDALRAELERR